VEALVSSTEGGERRDAIDGAEEVIWGCLCSQVIAIKRGEDEMRARQGRVSGWHIELSDLGPSFAHERAAIDLIAPSLALSSSEGRRREQLARHTHA
jgi:hypothetical protein